MISRHFQEKNMTKSIFGKFRKSEKKKKLQLVIAVSLSAVLLVALPVYAWFTHDRSIALTTKINAPHSALYHRRQ